MCVRAKQFQSTFRSISQTSCLSISGFLYFFVRLFPGIACAAVVSLGYVERVFFLLLGIRLWALLLSSTGHLGSLDNLPPEDT